MFISMSISNDICLAHSFHIINSFTSVALILFEYKSTMYKIRLFAEIHTWWQYPQLEVHVGVVWTVSAEPLKEGKVPNENP